MKKQNEKEFTKRWTMNDVVNWNKISENTAQLVLEQSETALKETLDTSKGLSERADRLLVIIIPFLSTLLVYVVNIIYPKLDEVRKLNNLKELLPLTACFAIVITFVSLFFVLRNIWHYEIRIPGEWPKNLLKTEYIDNDLNEHQQYLCVFLFTCENIQSRIDLNDITNAKRTRNNKIALIGLILIPFIPILSYPAYWFLQHHC